MKTDRQTAEDELRELARQQTQIQEERDRVKAEQERELQRQKEEEDRKREQLERLPKTALVVPEDGTRPAGLSTRTAARIMYKDEELFLNKPERYVLSIFVYMDDTRKTTKASNNARSKMTDNEVRRFIDLRNSVLALFYFGLVLEYDAYELEVLEEAIQAARKEHAGIKTEEVRKKKERQTQGLLDWHVLRLTSGLRAVERFCHEHNVPDYLRHCYITDAQTVVRRVAGGRLFDPFADTVQAEEQEKSAFWYLENRKNTFNTIF